MCSGALLGALERSSAKRQQQVCQFLRPVVRHHVVGRDLAVLPTRLNAVLVGGRVERIEHARHADAGPVLESSGCGARSRDDEGGASQAPSVGNLALRAAAGTGPCRAGRRGTVPPSGNRTGTGGAVAWSCRGARLLRDVGGDGRAQPRRPRHQQELRCDAGAGAGRLRLDVVTTCAAVIDRCPRGAKRATMPAARRPDRNQARTACGNVNRLSGSYRFLTAWSRR
jgi:hypothetical protein